jgi:zinc transport system substrate-binding protein
VRFAREHDVEVIYFETLVDPRVAQTIAREVGAKTMVLNPIEGLTPEEQAQGKDYLDLMRQNLSNLQAGLECR